MESAHKPVVGITLGDFNGVGPEVIIKCFNDSSMLKFCTPIIYGSSKIINKYKKILGIEDQGYFHIRSADQFNQKKVNIINCWEEDFEIEPGKVTETAGKSAWASLKLATEDLKKGWIDAIVTAPINKANIQNDEFRYPGHTEFFATEFSKGPNLMFLVGDNIRVGVVTGHLPLKEVTGAITQELIKEKLQIMLESLQKDFGIVKPRIAVLGLNPHAGENGLLGDEEKTIIRPVIDEFKTKNHLVFGPYPSDGFFGQMSHQKFDAVLAMYHDQGLIPFKTIAFASGVNFTAGLSVIRTSPDHGTAYDIAGKGVADENSFREAVFTACEILKNRSKK